MKAAVIICQNLKHARAVVRHIRPSARVIHRLTFWDIAIPLDIQFKLKGWPKSLPRNPFSPESDGRGQLVSRESKLEKGQSHAASSIVARKDLVEPLSSALCPRQPVRVPREPEHVEQYSQRLVGQAINQVDLSLEIIRIVQKARRLRLVLALKRIQKPFALWPLIVALIGPGRALVRLSKTSTLKMDQLRRPIPVYTLLLVLLLGVAGGAYASSALIHGTPNTGPNAPDFSIALSPPSLTLSPGSVATFTIRLSSIYGFAGSVNLNATPPTATSMTVASNPNSVSLLTGTASSTLIVLVPSSTPTGTFTMNLTGYSGRLSHLVQAFLLIVSPPPQDFTVVANATSMTLSQGSSATASLTISSVSGFSGIVNLTATVSPIIGNGPSATLNPSKVSVTSGGTANSLVSVTTSGSTPRQGYTIFVLATSGTFSHSLSISLTVQ